MNINKKKNGLLVALAVTAFLNGVVSQYFEPGVIFAKTDAFFTFFGVTLIFIWYYLDSKQTQYRRSVLLNAAVIAIGVIALPYCFFRSRGFKEGFIYSALFILVMIGWSVLQIGGAYAVLYGSQR